MKVKHDGKEIFSSATICDLGVPQGSVLGPLLFIIFINDLPFMLEIFLTKLFADDTTLIYQHTDLNKLIENFMKGLKPFIHWCHFNKLDINWAKTEFMFVSNTRQKLPTEIEINGVHIKVKQEFKLLGITIDNKLTFNNYSNLLKKIVQIKMFSIKRLFYLAYAVRLQFFKTFIAPHFDYCLTLFVYFSKQAISRIVKLYNFCLDKLLNIKSINSNEAEILNDHNNKLESFGLQNLHHRLLTRILTLSHKIINETEAPSELKKLLKPSSALERAGRTLRNHQNIVPTYASKNRYGESRFSFIFPRIINITIINDLLIPFNFFKTRVVNNINVYFSKTLPLLSIFN